jgi:hypothetical protein
LVLEAPDRLTASIGMMPTPDRGTILFVTPTWSGDPRASGVILDRVSALGTPIASTVIDTNLAVMMPANDQLTPRAVGGRHP